MWVVPVQGTLQAQASFFILPKLLLNVLPHHTPLPARRRLHDAAAYALTLSLLCLCTWGLMVLRDAVGDQRPYTILYLIPVAIGAALLDKRGGLVAAAAAVVLARVFLLNDHKHGSALLSFPSLAESIEFLSLLAGTLTVVLVTGRLRSALSLVNQSRDHLRAANHELQETNARLEEASASLRVSEHERRDFYRDVLQAVTGGKLRLVEPEEMPPADVASGPPQLSLPLTFPPDVTHLRQTLHTLACDMGMDEMRVFDLCTGATEAAANAIKHGSGGEASIWAGADAVIVQIADQGEGIAPVHLARATLEQGYSTRVSLGMGFHLMLQTSDVLVLSTTPQGTTLLLRVALRLPQSDADYLMTRYVGL